MVTTDSDEIIEIDIDYKILAKLLLVASFVNIPDLPTYQSHAGSGFKDFTLILSCLKSPLNNRESLVKILEDSQEEILTFINSVADSLDEFKKH